ncbi:melanocortin-2 receptor accessory protein [Sorex araneus]|uniref:melanocortin-2 receptor accessory protein n=1 Tax=Sorex araneus TaxID=42254 RepID=UPI002433BAC0|nr:melanocortin-2 receptor accessory protein [Sorex araneus]
MASPTNASAPYYSYEYYLDYLDLIPVDEKKLKVNKHSVVIAFWVGLAAFVLLLFLILLYMSWPGSPQARGHAQRPTTCPWAQGLHLPFCIRRQRPQGTPQTPASSVEEGGSVGGLAGPEEDRQGSASPAYVSPSTAPLWEPVLDGNPHSVG